MSEMSEEKTVSTEKQEIEAEKKTEAPTGTDTPKNVVYIGPNILKEGLKQWTIYTERPEELLEQLKERYGKEMARLFVPVTKLQKAREDLERAGTPTYLAFQEVSFPKGGNE